MQRQSQALRKLDHGVICGGSMAGLLAARVLSDFFRRVTLIEPDHLPVQAEPRKGVPQGRHVHLLLVRGQTILEGLFPGLGEELLAAGAVQFDSGREFGWHYDGFWRTGFDGGLLILSMSRPLLEAAIARRVRALANVTFREGARIEGFTDDGKGAVNGVRVGTRGAAAGEIEADLVVDAMGRGSPTGRWIGRLGYRGPDEELVGARVRYATCGFPRDRTWPERRALLVSSTSARRAAAVLPIEEARWLVTLISLFDEPSPHDHDSFIQFSKALPVDMIHDIIGRREPLGRLFHHRFPGSLRRRYERLRRVPEGLIVMGDALCSFNPVYGQGMTVSAAEAEELACGLERARRQGGLAASFPRRWFRAVKPIVDVAWNGVLIEDYRLEELASEQPASLQPLQWYMSRLHRATYRSATVTNQFYRVVNFIDPPRTLFRPRVVADVLLRGGASA